MGELGELVLKRQQLPASPPNPHAKVPPRMDRFITGQKMTEAYRNNWSPNPMLVRILEGSKY